MDLALKSFLPLAMLPWGGRRKASFSCCCAGGSGLGRPVNDSTSRRTCSSSSRVTSSHHYLQSNIFKRGGEDMFGRQGRPASIWIQTQQLELTCAHHGNDASRKGSEQLGITPSDELP
ncbi:hypothetical protein B0T18DRAFT_485039 [Schizothecium vesticola]|uniref:Uncharacterized protein n=1 Tax=Schizothecium vesticola TaxID=314040 RepID=A0AA40FBL0_9PEZI|nr:hypothetical protein B0T18DRAFT_485039 [Schizothecium vesticola]